MYIGRIALDLTDETGRAHLAAWIRQQPDGLTLLRCDRVAYRAWCKARDFEPMTPAEIDTLARLALRIMGRAA